MSAYLNDPTIIALVSALTSLIITINTMLKQSKNETKLDSHDRALNGDLDKRMAEMASYAVAFREATGKPPTQNELIDKAQPIIIHVPVVPTNIPTDGVH